MSAQLQEEARRSSAREIPRLDIEDRNTLLMHEAAIQNAIELADLSGETRVILGVSRARKIVADLRKIALP